MLVMFRSNCKFGHLILWLHYPQCSALWRCLAVSWTLSNRLHLNQLFQNAIHMTVVTDLRHVLSRLLQEIKSTSYSLQPRAHCFVLPPNFGDQMIFAIIIIPRMLYEKTSILTRLTPGKLHEF